MKCHSKENYLVLGGGNNWGDFRQFQAYAKGGPLGSVVEPTDKNYKTIYMPRNASKLSVCDIERIKAWVNNGSKQD